jgi:hypothetical protein
MTAFGNPLDGVIRNTTDGFNQTDSSLDPTRDFSFGLDPNQYSPQSGGTAVSNDIPLPPTDNPNNSITDQTFAPVGSPDAAAAIDTSGARPLDVQKSFDNQAGGGGANNSQASSGGGASADFLDNVLNNYHQSTYHLRFYTKGDASSGGGKGIIIAESGVTGFNIRSLELDVMRGGQNNRNTVSLHFKMTILEPLGASFLDALVQASKTLSPKGNWKQGYFYLDVSFKGYDENGVEKTAITGPGFPKGGVWTYKLNLTNIKFHLTSSGGTYDLTGLSTNDQASKENDESARISSTMDVKGKNLGELISDFNTQLNKVHKENGLNLYTFDMKLLKGDFGDPNSFTFDIKPTDPQHTLAYSQDDKSKVTAHLTPGTSIVDFLKTVWGATKEGQELALSSDKSIKPESLVATKYVERIMPLILPVVEESDYDQKTGKYKKKITFNVKGEKIQGIHLDPSEVQNSFGQDAIKKIQAYGGLKKRYNYIYTGMNTEVLELDISYDIAWAAIQPRNEGANYYADNYRQSAMYAPPDKVSSGGSSPASGGSGNSPSVNGGSATPASGSANSSSGNGVVQTGGTPANGSDNGGAGGQTSFTYIEDILNNADNANTNTVPEPISVEQSNNDARYSAGSGVATTKSRGRSLFGIVLDQQSGLNSLQRVNSLKIMGDPYWLGMDYVESITSTDTTGNLPNYTAGDITFLIYFKYPYNWAETGDYSFRENDIFNGVYNFTTCCNYFENGKFTQKLEGIRILPITPADANTLANAPSTGATANAGGTPAAASNANAAGTPTTGGGVSLSNPGTANSVATASTNATATTPGTYTLEQKRAELPQ